MRWWKWLFESGCEYQEPDFYIYGVFKTLAEMGAKYIDVLVDYTDK